MAKVPGLVSTFDATVELVHGRSVTHKGKPMEEYVERWGSGFQRVRLRERDVEAHAGKRGIRKMKRAGKKQKVRNEHEPIRC